MIGGTRVATTGLAIMLLAVSIGVGSSNYSVLLGLVGILVGASTIAVGVRHMDEGPATPTCPTAFDRLGALTAFLQCNLTVVGLIMTSSAITAVAGAKVGPALCCVMIALFLFRLWLINIRVLGD